MVKGSFFVPKMQLTRKITLYREEVYRPFAGIRKTNSYTTGMSDKGIKKASE